MSKKTEHNKVVKHKSYRRRFWRIIFIGSDDVDSFLENLSLMLSVNVSMTKVLESLYKEVSNKTFKKVVQEIIEGVNLGKSLSDAMRDTRVFKEYTLELVEAGERSGKLLHNLQLIVKQREKDRSVRGKVFSAMVYPVFVLFIGVIASVAIFGFVLPRVTRVFSQLDLELPWVTRVIIQFGSFLDESGHVFIPAVVGVLIFSIFFFFIFKPSKFIGQYVMLRLPVMGRLIKEIELARLGFNLGTLLNAGISIDKALNSLKNLTELRVYRKMYTRLAIDIQNGRSFFEAFGSYKKTDQLIPIPVQNIIEAGEQSASLNVSFDRIGEIYEKKTENTTKAMITLLEPLLLFMVWIGVAGIALSIIIPIYSLIGNFGSRDYLEVGEQEIVSSVSPVEEVIEEEDYEEPDQVMLSENDYAYMLLVDPDLDINLNVRSENTTATPIIFELEPGSLVEGLEEADGWYKINLPNNDGATGWVYGVYVTVQDE